MDKTTFGLLMVAILMICTCNASAIDKDHDDTIPDLQIQRVVTLDSSNSGQYSQVLFARDALLVFYHYAGDASAQLSKPHDQTRADRSAIRLIQCHDELCAKFTRKTLDDGRGKSGRDLTSCGRFLKATFTSWNGSLPSNSATPLLSYACGDMITMLVCKDILCNAWQIHDVAQSGRGKGDGGSYSYPLGLGTPLFYHGHTGSQSGTLNVFERGDVSLIDAGSAEYVGGYPAAVMTSSHYFVAYIGANYSVKVAVRAINATSSNYAIGTLDTSSTFRYTAATCVNDLPTVFYTSEITGYEYVASCNQWPCLSPSNYIITRFDQIGNARAHSCDVPQVYPFCPYGVFPQARTFPGFNNNNALITYYNATSPHAGALKLAMCNDAVCRSPKIVVLTKSDSIDGYGRDSCATVDTTSKYLYASFLNYGSSDANMTLGFVVATYR